MRTTETREVGTIHTVALGDDLSQVDLGPNVCLGSAHRRHRGVYLGRSWYLQGELGMLSFDEIGDPALRACEQFLADHGYRSTDDLHEWYVRTA